TSITKHTKIAVHTIYQNPKINVDFTFSEAMTLGTSAGKVLKSNSDLKFIRKIHKTSKPEAIIITAPSSISCNYKDGNIVATTIINIHLVLDSKATVLKRMESQGSSKEGEFASYLYGTSVDIDGNIYVCDSYNHRIQVFDSQGKFLWMFGKHGRGNGELSHPY